MTYAQTSNFQEAILNESVPARQIFIQQSRMINLVSFVRLLSSSYCTIPRDLWLTGNTSSRLEVVVDTICGVKEPLDCMLMSKIVVRLSDFFD